MRLGAILVLAAFLGSQSRPACADVASDAREAANLQKQVTSIMDVLRTSHTDPSTACANALDEMHTTDEQLRELSGAMQYDNETTPVIEHNSGEMGVGRDVLISDMQETIGACGPQARAACSAAAGAPLTATCARLRFGQAVTN